ncbi:hypothetical protein B0A52_07548 [Exophiala mesophila]|uniref:Aminotransferase class I/classII large domain-containing protein n=1 Tax=Exophiala mesophila TaxID=212818 RepID=A0A438MYS6_EXOME|nr:hypothetical protein B0A52_07548 [Exophiala mesophila]
MTPLEARLSSLLTRRKSQSKLRVLKASEPGSVDFSSNDFVSLSSNSELQSDYLRALQKTIGSHGLGSTGSRLLDGNSTFAEDLEKDIARFHGAQDALLTNSGYDANVGLFGFLPQPTDHVVYDELIHASVHDGLKLCRAESQVSFKHNDLDHLRQILMSLALDGSRQSSVFIAVESVYSMDGDLAPLKEMTELIDELFPRKNCFLIVDEAHATGYFGADGRGRVCELGLEKKILIRLHTYGKAMAASGAAVLCSPVIKSYLINYARPLIYTTFMSFPSLLSIKVAYDWLQQGKTNQLATNLWGLVQHLHESLQSLSKEIPANGETPLVTFPSECPESPIFAIFSPQPRALATYCQAAGFVVRAIFPPTVPEGTQRVRVCLHAGNTIEQIDNFVATIKEWLVREAQERSGVSSHMPSDLREVVPLVPKL